MDANELFDAFISATSFTNIQQIFVQLCEKLSIDPHDSANLYKNLKKEMNDWRAKKLWTLLDKRLSQKEYCNQSACARLDVLVIGAGPCGLRSAIECALLGASVILVEQRDCFSRNNVLHIWPFVIQDLKNLGMKIFYPKFCRGSIDHISIRQLQIFLLKIALVVGVQVNHSVTFKNLRFPKKSDEGKVSGWRAEFEPAEHILSEYVFDALIGADGKRNTVPGFPRREMRGKLAIGITANFINQRTLEEEKVPEISGVAYIFNQQFFKDMKENTGVDLENIVYYKDETHYFVMCAKKQSLIDKGVIIKDNEDISLLLSAENVDQEKLCKYAVLAADFATDGKLPALNFAANHNGHEDVAMFDFTSLFSAQCSVRLVERHDQRLLMAIVGDSLHEPFWPTGSGVARGFLGVFDTAWMLRSYGLNEQGIMLMIAERESIYRLLAQAKPDNLHKQIQKYTIDPRTRYISLEMTVQPHEVSHLIDTDNPRHVETNRALPLRESSDDGFIKRYKLWKFCQKALACYKLPIFNLQSCWNDGRALIALIAKFRSDLVDYIALLYSSDEDGLIQEAFKTMEKHYSIAPPCCNPSKWIKLHNERRIEYIRKIINCFLNDSNMLLKPLNVCKTGINAQKRKAVAQNDTQFIKRLEVKNDELFGEKKILYNCANQRENSPHLPVDDLREEKCSEEKQFTSNFMDYRSKIAEFQNETNKKSKIWTKRPTVDKLNPQRLQAVERIVTGTLEVERASELYKNKRRLANIHARKMEKKDLEEMETKLEQTGMGVLFNKDRFRVMSSKEEKIVSISAAAARQSANEGFKRDDAKYKDIDEKLFKAEIILKNQSLTGVEAVSKALCKPTGKKSGRLPPPTLPKNVNNTNGLAEKEAYDYNEDQENFKVQLRTRCKDKEYTRPASLPTIEVNYDSVNVRRQQNCRLCNHVVYLAERMQVEGMFIHKKCFRCAFCERPLRLGHCSQDRGLEQFNPRFYCTQHINIPISEKILRLQKIDSRFSKINGNDTASPTVFTNGVMKHLEVTANDDETSEKQKNLLKSCVTDLNSPSVLLGRTMEKMRVQREAAAHLAVLDIQNKSDTPERAEFETFKQNLRADLITRKNAEIIDQHKFSKDQSSPSNGTSISNTLLTEEETSSDEEDDLMEADLIDLEKLVEENIDLKKNVVLSDAQALSLLEIFKKRRPSISSSIENDVHNRLESICIENSERKVENISSLNKGKGLLAQLFPVASIPNIADTGEQSDTKNESKNRKITVKKEDVASFSNDPEILPSSTSSKNISNDANILNASTNFRRSVRRIKKRAELIAKQKEAERVQNAQDIQRSLQENEIRKAEVHSVGRDLENHLREDPINHWVLEQWLLYVCEYKQLQENEDFLRKKVSLMETIDEYAKLQNKLKEVQVFTRVNQSINNQNEKDLLKRMLQLVEKRDNLRQSLKEFQDKSRNHSIIPRTELAEESNSYKNYSPVFLVE